jgi:peptidylprolyl isomerase
MISTAKPMRSIRVIATAVAVSWLLAVATGVHAVELGQASASKKMTRTSSGLQYFDDRQGTGATPKTGDTCVVHYTGWLWEKDAKGKKFDSSADGGQPFSFHVGKREVIKGWDEGVSTMKVGGKRQLLIPPELGYGRRGAGGVIPPNATLLFEIELIAVK